MNMHVHLQSQHMSMQALSEQVRHVRSPMPVIHAEEGVHTAFVKNLPGARCIRPFQVGRHGGTLVVLQTAGIQLQCHLHTR